MCLALPKISEIRVIVKWILSSTSKHFKPSVYSRDKFFCSRCEFNIKTFAIDCNWKIIRKCRNIIGNWNSFKKSQLTIQTILIWYMLLYHDHILLYTYMERWKIYICVHKYMKLYYRLNFWSRSQMLCLQTYSSSASLNVFYDVKSSDIGFRNLRIKCTCNVSNLNTCNVLLYLNLNCTLPENKTPHFLILIFSKNILFIIHSI